MLFLLEHQIDDEAQNADEADEHEPHESVETELRFCVLYVAGHCCVLLDVKGYGETAATACMPDAEDVATNFAEAEFVPIS
jgi:hypothetical protein